MLYDNNSMRTFDIRLAKVTSTNSAIIVGQIQYWLKMRENEPETPENHFFDGRRWVFNTFDKWHKQLDCMSIATMIREFAFLEENGIVLVGRYNDYGYDRTKWYSLDYEKIDAVINAGVKIKKSKLSNCEDPFYQNDKMQIINGITTNYHGDKNEIISAIRTIPDTTTDTAIETNITETATETTTQREPDGSELQRDANRDRLASAPVPHPETVEGKIEESGIGTEEHNVVQLRVYGIQTVDVGEEEMDESKEENNNPIKTADDFPPVDMDSVRVRIGNIRPGHGKKEVMICQLIANIYLEKYAKAMGRPHPANITDKTLNALLDLVSDWWPEWSCGAYGVGIEQWRLIIDKHFATKYADGCDYSMNHFASKAIVENRANEAVYRGQEAAAL